MSFTTTKLSASAGRIQSVLDLPKVNACILPTQGPQDPDSVSMISMIPAEFRITINASDVQSLAPVAN